MRDIDNLGKDLRKVLREGIERSKHALANEIIDEAAGIAPHDTGRLASSGFAYVDGKLVAQSPFENGPVFTHHVPSGERDTVEFVFSTPKKAGENANVYYTSGGKWFDYALIQSERQYMWINIVVETITLDIIDREFSKLW